MPGPELPPDAEGIYPTGSTVSPVRTLADPSLSAYPRSTSLIARESINPTMPLTKPETKARQTELRQELSDISARQRDLIQIKGLKKISGGFGRPGELSADDKVKLGIFQEEYDKAVASGDKEGQALAKTYIDNIKAKDIVDPEWADLEATKSMLEDQVSWLNANESDVDDGKESGGGGGSGAVDAATAYLKTESRKTSEIKRQFDDFMNRAEGYYGLVKDEQSIYGSASDQYYQDLANAKKLNMIPTANRPVPTAWGSGLSGIVRPSLPDYVSPDYRLNEAVGLPGGQGFTDPDYDENGMPKYAHGTKPPLGSGERFSKLSQAVGSPALAAWIGRKKYGDKKMEQTAAKGRGTPKYANGTSEFAAFLEQLKAEGRVPVALMPPPPPFPPRGIPWQEAVSG